jgi:hypothetical protein
MTEKSYKQVITLNELDKAFNYLSFPKEQKRDFLRSIRIALGMKTTQLSRRMHVKQQTISK